MGEDHTDEIPKGPTNAEQVVALGTQYGHRSEDLGHHCGEQCTTHAYITSYIYNPRYDACGGNGGNGGNSGKGGNAADLQIHVDSGAVNHNLIDNPGSDGTPGKGGRGANGILSDIEYLGDKREEEDAGCHGFLGWDCDITIPNNNVRYEGYHVSNHDNPCNGQDGMAGK